TPDARGGRARATRGVAGPDRGRLEGQRRGDIEGDLRGRLKDVGDRLGGLTRGEALELLRQTPGYLRLELRLCLFLLLNPLGALAPGLARDLGGAGENREEIIAEVLGEVLGEALQILDLGLDAILRLGPGEGHRFEAALVDLLQVFRL